jgi:probable rRNA maturation factor
MRFEKLKNDILGKEYSLSVAFVGPKKSREINKKYRKKDRPTNVLSFSLYQNEGELVLCNAVIKKEAKIGKQSYGKWLLFLVIHGMLHLKGLEHSSTMEKQEKFYFEKYDKKHNSRNRRRLLNDKSSGGRIHQRRKKP